MAASDRVIIKADVLALPNLPSGFAAMSEAAWVMVLAVANNFGADLDDEDDYIKQMRIYLAAHLVLSAVTSGQGAAGPVTSQGAGQVRISYGLLAQAAGQNAWAGTKYGQMLNALIGMSSAHGPILV